MIDLDIKYLDKCLQTPSIELPPNLTEEECNDWFKEQRQIRRTKRLSEKVSLTKDQVKDISTKTLNYYSATKPSETVNSNVINLVHLGAEYNEKTGNKGTQLKPSSVKEQLYKLFQNNRKD